MKMRKFTGRNLKKILAAALAGVMACSVPASENLTAHAAAKKYVSLNTSFKTLKTGQSGYQLKLKNNTIGWKIQKASVTDKKVVSISKKTADYVQLEANEEGRATVRLKLKTSRRREHNTKTLRCRIRVISADAVQDVPAEADGSSKTLSSVDVSTQTGLVSALADKRYTAINIKTDQQESFVIPKGTYDKVHLTVDAPQSDVVNNGVFASVMIRAVKNDTWTEHASGNEIRIEAALASLTAAKDAVIRHLVIAKPDADIKVHADGVISKLTVSTRAKLNITGSVKSAIPVTAESGAFDTLIVSSVKLDIHAKAGFTATLKPGAEDSTLRVLSQGLTILVNNDTSKKIEVTKANASKIYVYAGAHTKVMDASSGSYENSAAGSGSYHYGGGTSGGTNIPSGGQDQPEDDKNQPGDTNPPSGGGTDSSNEDTSAVSRGQWLQNLAETIGMNLEADMLSVEYYYADTKASQYAAAIETAQMYGLLPDVVLQDEVQDVPFFYPDEPATREFAAYTAMAAMGYCGRQDAQDWEDWNETVYKDAAALAVRHGFMELTGSQFMPKNALTGSQAEKIQQRIKSIQESAVIKEADAYDRNVYAEEVLEGAFDSVESYRIEKLPQTSQVKVVVPAAEAVSAAEAGRIVIMPQTDDYPGGLALKIDRVITSADGGKEYLCSSPQPAEVFDKIDFAGNADPVTNRIQGTDDVEVEYNDEIVRSRSITGKDIDINESTSLPDKFTFVMPQEGMQIVSGQTQITVKGSAEVTIPDVSCIVSADTGLNGLTFQELTFSVTKKVKLKQHLSLQYTDYETGSQGTVPVPVKKEIGRIPFTIKNTGLSAELIFFVNISARGEVNVSYEFESVQGFQYKDSSLRWIHDFSSSLDVLQAKGSAYLTLGTEIQMHVFGFLRLAEISLEGGAQIQASFVKREDMELYCSDLEASPVLKFSVDEHTPAGIYLKGKGYPLTYSFFDKSAYCIRLHIENGIKTDACTYGKGSLSGKVVSFSTQEAISGARVQIYKDDRLIQTQYTSADGMYTIQNLEAGTYRIDISANGYQRYTNEGITIERNQAASAETAQMVSRTEETGTLKGCILDATTAAVVSGAAFEVRDGWNITSGEVYQQGVFDHTGRYELTLPAGNYTLLVQKEGYIRNLVNIAIEENTVTARDITLAPSGAYDTDYVRIVLTWGEFPSDLDSHLFGPSQDGNAAGMFHTYYAAKNYEYSGQMIANLDVDDVTSYGPETTTIYVRNTNKKYSFFIHDFTNRSSTSSTALSSSGAQVQIFIGNELKRTFNVPAGKEGTVWHVFDYDAAGETITPVNKFSYSSDPGSLGVTPFNLSPEEEMLKEFANLPEK